MHTYYIKTIYKLKRNSKALLLYKNTSRSCIENNDGQQVGFFSHGELHNRKNLKKDTKRKDLKVICESFSRCIGKDTVLVGYWYYDFVAEPHVEINRDTVDEFLDTILSSRRFIDFILCMLIDYVDNFVFDTCKISVMCDMREIEHMDNGSARITLSYKYVISN